MLRSVFAFQLAFRSAGDESEFIAYIMDVRDIVSKNELIIIKLVSECPMIFDPRGHLLLVLRWKTFDLDLS